MYKSAGDISLLGCQQQSLQVSDVAVHSSITDQAKEVESAILGFGFVKCLDECRLGGEGFFLNRHVDRNYVLVRKAGDHALIHTCDYWVTTQTHIEP